MLKFLGASRLLEFSVSVNCVSVDTGRLLSDSQMRNVELDETSDLYVPSLTGLA